MYLCLLNEVSKSSQGQGNDCASNESDWVDSVPVLEPPPPHAAKVPNKAATSVVDINLLSVIML